MLQVHLEPLSGVFHSVVVLQIIEFILHQETTILRIFFPVLFTLYYYSLFVLNYVVTKNLQVLTLQINNSVFSGSCGAGESSAVKATPTKSKRVATPKRAAGPKRARATRVSSEEEEVEEEMPKRKAKRLKSDSEDESGPQVNELFYTIWDY